MADRASAIAETALQLIFHADNLTVEKITSIAKNIRRLATSFQVEARRVKNFKIDIKWKSRVINVPRAVDNFKSLIDELTHGIHDKILTLETPFLDFAAAVHLAPPPPDPGVSRIASSFTELENFITALNILVGDIDTAIENALALGALFDRVLQDIQHLEDLFLQQHNSRKIERLADGGSIKIRVGQLETSLHTS
jgi:hypothetical protein